MGKGNVSIDTLIFIVIGIVVLAVVVYLMFFSGKKSNLNCGLCRAKFAEWCQKCAIAEGNWNSGNWLNNVNMGSDLKNCISDCLKVSPDVCSALKDKCKEYLPNITGVF